MPEQSEAGHVGQGVDLELSRGEDEPCLLVELRHHRDDLPGQFLRSEAALDRRGRDPRAERFGEDEVIAGLRSKVSQDLLRVHDSGDRHSVLWLGVLDRVPAEDGDARFCRLAPTAGEDLGEHLQRKPGRKAHQIQREQRTRSHRPDVRERIGGSDLAELKRIVDHRRKEIDRLHHRERRGEAIHRGVIAGTESHQRSRVLDRSQVAQNLRQVRGADLPGSTRAVAKLGEPGKQRYRNL